MLQSLTRWLKQALIPCLMGGVTAAALVVFATEFVTQLMVENHTARQRSEVVSKVATVRAKLEGEINSTLHLTRGLIAYVATHPDVDINAFSQLASEIIAVGRSVRNIALARNNVLTHMYPLAGNEAALGLVYKDNPKQWPAVKMAMEKRGTVVAGPVNLVQGGQGFIARTPIYTRTGLSGDLDNYKPRYWGLASIVIDTDDFFLTADIEKELSGIRYAIRGNDGLGAKGSTIHGDASLFDLETVTASIMLPNGSWQIAALPSGGWGPDMATLWLPRMLGWLLAAVIGLLIASLIWARAANRRLALHDHLTGLPNRRLLEDRLEQMMAYSNRDKSSFAVIYIDLDGFKQVNDEFGHKTGDSLLIEVAKRLQSNVRAIDTVARIGGDEFIILAHRIGNQQHISAICDTLNQALHATLFIEHHKVKLKASMGVALFPEDARNIDDLLRKADEQMYVDKHGNKVRQVDFG